MANDTGKITSAISQAGVNLTNATNANGSQTRETISNAASTVNSVTNQIKTSVNDMKEGVDLIQQKTSEQTDIEHELWSLGDYLADKVAEIMNLTNQIYKIQSDPDGNKVVTDKLDEIHQAEDEDKKNEAILDTGDMNVGSESVGDIKGAKSQVGVLGSGFAILGNIFTSNMAAILKGLQPLQQIQVATNNQVTMAEAVAKEKAQPKEDEGAKAKGNFKSYLEGLVGPLESVASGILLLSLSFVALSLVPLNAAAALAFAGLCGAMVVVFLGLNVIAKRYKEYGLDTAMDPKQKGSPGNLFGILESFSKMVLLMSITFLVMSVTASLLLERWPSMLIGLVATFVVMVGSIFAMKALSQIALPEVDPEKGGALPMLIQSIAKLVAIIVVTALVCELLWPIILPGLGKALLIFIVTGAMVTGLIFATSKIRDVNPKSIDALSKLMREVTIMVGVVAVLTIILSIIPLEMLVQGIIGVGLIMLLCNLTIKNVISACENLEQVNEKKIKDLMGLMIAVTVMIGVVSIMVVVLGSMSIAQLIMGMVSVTLIALLPKLMIKLFKDINTEEVFEALKGVVMSSLIVVALAGLAWLITALVPDPTRTIIAVTAVLVMAVAVAMIGLAATVLAMLTNILMTATPFGPVFLAAVLGVGLASVIAITLALTGVGITAIMLGILGDDGPQQVLTAAMATLALAAAFGLIAVTAIALAALAIPLGFAIGMALIAIGSIVGFVTATAYAMRFLQNPDFKIDAGPLVEITEQVKQLAASMVTLAQPITQLATVAIQIGIASTLALIGMSFTFFFLTSIAGEMSLVNLIFDALDFNTVTANICGAMNSMVGVITGMNVMNTELANYKSMGLATYLKVMGDLNMFDNIIHRMSSMGKSEDGGSGIDALADSLSKLASTSDGLSQVAQALKEVAEATKELNEVGDINIKHSVANIAQTTEDVTQIKTPEAPKEEKSEDNKLVLDMLQKVVDAITGMNNNVSGSMSGLNLTMNELKVEVAALKNHIQLH